MAKLETLHKNVNDLSRLLNNARRELKSYYREQYLKSLKEGEIITVKVDGKKQSALIISINKCAHVTLTESGKQCYVSKEGLAIPKDFSNNLFISEVINPQMQRSNDLKRKVCEHCCGEK